MAIPTGGDAIDVLDVDARAVGSGFDALERVRRAGLSEGWACIVRTPSGGLHFYYPADPARPQGSWSLGGSHVDFRGSGGYVLAPPSRVRQANGGEGRYEVIAVGRRPYPVDADSIRAFLKPPVAVKVGTEVALSRDDGADAARIASWVATRAEGSRNGSLFWAACRFAELRVPEPDARLLLLESARDAGLPDSEAAATIGSAYRRAASSAARVAFGTGLSR